MSWALREVGPVLNKDDKPTATFMEFRHTELPGYWEIRLTEEPHRKWWTVLFDGWVEVEMAARDYMEGWEVRVTHGRRRIPNIPPEVMSHLPKETV